MILQIRTQQNISVHPLALPDCVKEEISRCISQGEDRGCILIAEESKDLEEVKRIINYDVHPCEWVNQLGQNGEYLSALYVMNNDFAITLLVARAIAPDAILRELEG